MAGRSVARNAAARARRSCCRRTLCTCGVASRARRCLCCRSPSRCSAAAPVLADVSEAPRHGRPRCRGQQKTTACFVWQVVGFDAARCGPTQVVESQRHVETSDRQRATVTPSFSAAARRVGPTLRPLAAPHGGCVFDSSRASTLVSRHVAPKLLDASDTPRSTACADACDLSDTPRPRVWPATLPLVRHASAKGVPRDTSTCPTRPGRRFGPTRATCPTSRGVSDEDSGGVCWLTVHAHREPNRPLLFANTFPSNSPQVLVALWVHELGDPCVNWLVRKPEHALRLEGQMQRNRRLWWRLGRARQWLGRGSG